MDIEKLRSANRLQPFRPFLLHTSSGQSYLVSDNETMLATPLIVVLVKVNGTGQFAMIDPDNITELTYDIPKKKGKK